MSDILQTDAGDIAINDNDLSLVDGGDEVKQRLTQRLRTFLGEWFLDTSLGVPYYEEVLVKSPNGRLAEAAIKAEIRATPGVLDLLAFTFDVDKATRKGTIEFKVRSATGDVGLIVEV